MVRPKMLRSSSVTGKAIILRRNENGIQKLLKKKKKVKVKTRSSSLLNLAQVADRPLIKKTKKKRHDVADLSGASTSTQNFPIPRSSSETAGPSYNFQASFVPLVIDSPGTSSGRPSFSLTDESFETPEAEVLISHVRKAKSSKKRRSRSATTSFEVVVSEQNKEIQVFPVREWCLLIAVLPHPTTVRLGGTTLIQVISGSINVLGYVLKQFHGFIPVFSSSKVMSLDIKTETTESICRQAARLQIVKNALLENKVPENLADKILNSCDNSSVIVAFRKDYRSSDIHFASSLMPNVFLLKNTKNDIKRSEFKNFGFKLSSENSALEFPQCENFISNVISRIQDLADDGSTPVPRVVVQGNKGVGKSTFLRYMINRVLNEFDTVYYLDGDPGQSEFAPAGCVSLVKVTAPLLGPPFTHQTTPEKMFFLGTVDVKLVPEKYSSCVKLLIDYYNENCSDIPLFVNTMGWTMGIGLKLLEELKSNVLPTDIVKIVDDQWRRNRDGSRAPADEPLYSGAQELTYESFAPVDEARQLMTPAERRDLSILAYLGKCQSPYSSVHTLNSITPYCVLWKHLALYVGGHKYATEHILYSFNGLWVALLSVDESLIMECEGTPLPKLLSAEPVGQDCYGFGVIRAIDVAKKAFYIITPEPKERLRKVNAIMKGSVHLPAILYTSQKMNKQIPYIAEVTGKSNFTSKHVNRRKFRPNKSQLEDQ